MDHKWKILNEMLFEEQMKGIVEPALGVIRKEGRLAVAEGELYYELYPQKERAPVVVICHGFSESAEKYREFIYYLHQAGYQAVIWDQRGHGKSFRQGENPEVVHVEDFEDYVRDLHVLMEQVVKGFADGMPLYLYAHSMGGCVGARYLESYPGDFQKAVLNAPMLAIRMGGCPVLAAKAICDVAKFMGRGKKRLFTQGEFDPDEPFSVSCADSRARHAYYQEIRRQNRCYQTSSASYSWGRGAIRAGEKAVKRKNAALVDIPVLLCQAGRDGQVKSVPQKKFIRRVQKGRLERYPHTKHEIYRADNAVLEPYMEKIVEFYGDL